MPTADSPSNVRSGVRSSSSPLAPSRERGQPDQSGGVKTLEAQPEPPTLPCYIITARSGGACERRPVSTAGELQAGISNLVNRDTHVAAPGPAVSTAALGKQTERVNDTTRPLITIRGLPGTLLSALLHSPLDVDPAFVEAHAAGACYRPLGRRRRYAHWDYPEMVVGHRQAMVDEQPCPGFEYRPAVPESLGADLARQPVVWPVADAHKALAAVFCRASLWEGRDVDVLFLDKPCWEGNGAWRKARRAGRLTGIQMPVSEKIGPNRDEWKGQEMPSLESILQESLTATHKDSVVFQVLEETVYEQWLELFEVLRPRARVARREEIPLEWRILQCLERNIDMARSIERSRTGTGNLERSCVSPDDWRSLMQRLQLRVAILAARPRRVTNREPGKAFQEGRAYIPSRGRSEADRPSSQGSDANQRALDRVTYLGGVLLPFSTVSGVLSMNESFEPGQPLFWVFWVATIPLTLFTVLVIYADKLRQVEVWAEVLDPSASVSEESDEEDEKSTKSGRADEMQGTEKGRRKTTPAFGIAKYDGDHQPETVTYSAGGDIVIDLGAPSTDFQHMSAEPAVPNREDWRTDSDHDLGGTSSDEDTPGEAALPITAGGAAYRPGWKKKQLGWKGAAMCILRIQKPLWALEGTPAAARR